MAKFPNQSTNPGQKLPAAPAEAEKSQDPAYTAFLRDWLNHVQAVRIGNTPPLSEATRERIPANERLISGWQRTFH